MFTEPPFGRTTIVGPDRDKGSDRCNLDVGEPACVVVRAYEPRDVEGAVNRVLRPPLNELVAAEV